MTRDELIRVIEQEADQLDRWANESSTGGWSTHQVNPMRERANELRRIAARAKGTHADTTSYVRPFHF